jgi:hypothetical protein
MTSSNGHKVKFAYISDFYESEAAIVFAGSAASLNKFATMLLDLAHGKQRQNIHSNEIDLFESVRATNIWLEITSLPYGMKRIQKDENATAFAWGIAPERAALFSELVRAVAESNVPCHHYLDSGWVDEVLVVVSKDEYPTGSMLSRIFSNS